VGQDDVLDRAGGEVTRGRSTLRAILDANVLISFLLSVRADSPAVMAVEAALDRSYTLILPDHVVRELDDRTRRKPYLAARISPAQSARLIDALTSAAGEVAALPEPFPRVGSDPGDDYLFAHAVATRADYLVSDDRGVLAVRRAGPVEVVTPAEFVALLGVTDRP
jgi:predicted nucleic acid-binding protein